MSGRADTWMTPHEQNGGFFFLLFYNVWRRSQQLLGLDWAATLFTPENPKVFWGLKHPSVGIVVSRWGNLFFLFWWTIPLRDKPEIARKGKEKKTPSQLPTMTTLLFHDPTFTLGHFSMQMGKTGITLPTFWLEDNRSTPQPQPPQTKPLVWW